VSYSVPPSPPPPPFGFAAGQAAPAKTLTDRCWDYAANNFYSGPPVLGPTFVGWPIDELLKRVEPKHTYRDLVGVEMELRSKYGPPFGIGSSGRGGGIGVSTPRPSSRPYTFEEQLAMRMRWGRRDDHAEWAPGFEHVAVHAPAGGTMVHVWVITKDAQSTVLEDEVSLFPSDALVTKLNMLKG
jgi:hypothetical protein